MNSLITIFGMAAVTYFTRIFGFVLSDRMSTVPDCVNRFLINIPGTIIISIIVPQIFNGKKEALIAAVICFMVAVRFRNMVLVMITGVITIYFLRNHILF